MSSTPVPPASARPKPRVVYIHGDGVLHWSFRWVPRLQQALHTAGFPTFFELFPDSIEARAEYWLPFLEDHVQAGERDVLLGWSCGAVAAMRFAEEHRVRGLVLVAPYFTDLGLPVVRRSGWVTRPWSWERIRAHAEHIAIFHSDQDPYIAAAEFAALATHLHTPAHTIPGAQHFADQDDFPELLVHILQTYGSAVEPCAQDHMF